MSDVTASYDLLAEPDRCYQAVVGRDRRFDGLFYTAVRTTGIYCRPSCPAITPRRTNVRFFKTAAAAQASGFRACRRCRPDLTPGSPEWDIRADVAGRAMRMIADGVVEREGVPGLAARAGYTARHLSRVVTQELGAGPLALARAQRAHTARILIETTGMRFADVAFAAGFASVRQFNATMQEVYASSPSQLRARRDREVVGQDPSGAVTLSLAVREPFDFSGLATFLRSRLVNGLEAETDSGYQRSLRLPHGPGLVELAPGAGVVSCRLRLADLRDLATAVERCRRLLDLDADPVTIDSWLSADPILRPLVMRRPGIRVPGHVDGFEAAVRAVVGQQISVPAATTVLGQITERYGSRLDGSTALSRVFPDPETLSGVDPTTLPMPRTRGRTLVGLAQAVASGDVVLDRSADRVEVRQALLELPGIGPWTADYIALRALGDPDVFLGTDLGVRRALSRLGIGEPGTDPSRRWRPWRSYALMHVWGALADDGDATPPSLTKVTTTDMTTNERETP